MLMTQKVTGVENRSQISHRRSQDFLWGARFSSKKLTTFLLVASHKTQKTA